MSAVNEKRIRAVPLGTVGGRDGEAVKAFPLQVEACLDTVFVFSNNEGNDVACRYFSPFPFQGL